MKYPSMMPRLGLSPALVMVVCVGCAGGGVDEIPVQPSAAPNAAQSPSVGPAATEPAATVPAASSADFGTVTDNAPKTLGPGANAPLRAFQVEIEAAAGATGMPASLLGALIWQESRADAQVAGGGLTQMGVNEFADIQAHHPEVVGTLQEPAANIMAGAFYVVTLRDEMSQRYGHTDWATALRAYNSGPNGVDPNDLNATPAGTGDPLYITRLTKFWQIIASGTGTLPP